VTNDNGAVWGATILTARAGIEVDVTPAPRALCYNDYLDVHDERDENRGCDSGRI